MRYISQLLAGPRPAPLQDISIPTGLVVLFLGPHPDDFDAVGVTMHRLQAGGATLHVAVDRSGSGIEDGYCSPPTPEVKAAIRAGGAAAQLPLLRSARRPPDLSSAGRRRYGATPRQPAQRRSAAQPHRHAASWLDFSAARPRHERRAPADGGDGLPDRVRSGISHRRARSTEIRRRSACGPTSTRHSERKTRSGRRSCCASTIHSSSAT